MNLYGSGITILSRYSITDQNILRENMIAIDTAYVMLNIPQLENTDGAAAKAPEEQGGSSSSPKSGEGE